MRAVDVSIVAFRPEHALLRELLDSLAEPTREPLACNLFLHDNAATDTFVEAAAERARQSQAFARVEVAHSANVGFGRGHNANAARGDAPFILVLNQDCVLEPGVLEALVDSAERDDERIAAWELRQIPYEHPKAYDAVSLDTPWASGAAVLLRRKAFEEAGGFEPRIFMYGEDVDLSWRLRARGWRVVYRPRFAVVHRAYKHAGEVKPLQVFGGVMASLCLRARYGGFLRTLQGLVMLAGEIVAPSTFRGRRRGLALAGLQFLMRWPYFAWTRVAPAAGFRPTFNGWGYELRREGAFVEGISLRAVPARNRPLVSILIRTVDRQAMLREALQSCANQTYPNLEVIVIEDGPERSRDLVASFADRLRVRYLATGRRSGRARAGNVALAEARGEWINFLDDDDLLFADHVELLVNAVQKHGAAGAYALAWETATEYIDRGAARYEELHTLTRYWQRFDRLVLWHHNYLPIQAVMFHRRLWERYGGFDEEMDQLEDWNLWTRYTLEDDFVLVEKTTSKYRVPANARIAADRQARLDRAYADAIERQRKLFVTLSPRAISEMADAYTGHETVTLVAGQHLRRIVGSNRLLARLAAYRNPARIIMRRLGRVR